MLSASTFFTKDRVEILWQHEDAACALIAADVVMLDPAEPNVDKCHLRCALFGVPSAVSVVCEYSVSYAYSSNGVSRTQVECTAFLF